MRVREERRARGGELLRVRSGAGRGERPSAEGRRGVQDRRRVREQWAGRAVRARGGRREREKRRKEKKKREKRKKK